eukprot:5768682-Prymnesium_polylepis.1
MPLRPQRDPRLFRGACDALHALVVVRIAEPSSLVAHLLPRRACTGQSEGKGDFATCKGDGPVALQRPRRRVPRAGGPRPQHAPPTRGQER